MRIIFVAFDRRERRRTRIALSKKRHDAKQPNQHASKEQRRTLVIGRARWFCWRLW